MLRYAVIAKKSGEPCVVPTQRKIKPSEVKHLYRAVTAAFRAAADAL